MLRKCSVTLAAVLAMATALGGQPPPPAGSPPAAPAALPAMLPPLRAEPEAVTGKAGELVVIDSKAKGEVSWYVDERLRTPGRHYVDAAKKVLVVAAPAGRYLVIAFGVEGTRPTFTEWHLSIEGGPTPGPDPGPDPIPPPAPTLPTQMRAAYKADVAAGKGGEKERSTLSATFGTLPTFMDNTLLKTVADVRQVVASTLSAVMPKGSLPGVAKVVGDHIAARVPEGATVTLTPELRERFKATFREIQAAVEAAK